MSSRGAPLYADGRRCQAEPGHGRTVPSPSGCVIRSAEPTTSQHWRVHLTVEAKERYTPCAMPAVLTAAQKPSRGDVRLLSRALRRE